MNRLLALLAITLVAVGCQKKPTLEGNWTIAGDILQGVGTSADVSFASERITLKVKGTVPPQLGGGDFTMEAAGPYKMEEQKLTVTVDSVKVDASKLSAAIQQQAKLQESDPGVKKLLGEALTGTVTFEEDNKTAKIALAGGKTMTLTRS